MTSPSGEHVADIYADLHPDVSNFADELKAKLRNLPDFKVLVRPNITGFRKDLQDKLKVLPAVAVSVKPAGVAEFRRQLQRELKALPSVNVDVDNKAALASVAGIGSAIRALPTTVNLDVDTTSAAASVAALGAAIRGLSAGSVNVDLDTTAAMGKVAALDAALKAISSGSVKITVTMPNATSVGQRIGRAAARAFLRAFNQAVRTARPVAAPTASPAASRRAGTESGGEFANGFRTAVAAALRSLPEPTIGVATNQAEQDIRDLHSELRQLSTQRVGVDIDARTALREIDRIEADLHRLAVQAPNVQIQMDTARAEAALRRFREQVRALNDPGQAARQGAVSGGAFGNAYRRGVEQATRNLQPVQINANTDAVTRDIELVRQRLASLATQRVGIDIDAATAFAEVQRLEADLRRLGAQSPSIQVQADTAATAARLAALQAQLRALGATRTDIDVDVDTGRARSELAGLGFASGLSRGAIQSLIAAGIAIGPAIVPAAAAAAAALAAIGPAAFLGIAGIGAAVIAFQGVGDAVKALGDAQSRAAKTGATAAAQAKQVASAQDGVRDAVRGVGEAERNLAAAQRDALRAQQDINRARQEAREALEDLNHDVVENGQAIRQANLDFADAEAALAKVSNLPVDNRQRVEAQLAYDNAEQALARLTTRQKRLAAEQEKAAKVGIEGSERVQAAKEREADAQERVRDAAVAVTRAQEQVVAAQRNLQTALTTTSATGGSAVDTLREKMEALTPAGQKFARFLHGLRDEFAQIKGAAEAGLFPGLQAGLEAMLPVLPQIVTFVSRVSKAMGSLFEAAGKALASPFWQRFFDQMGLLAGPLFDSFGRILGALAEGVASLILAFGPLSVDMFDGIARAAESFAKWASTLADNPQFQTFLEYVRTNGPTLLTLLGQFAELFIRLGIALAPLGAIVLDGLVEGLTWLNRQDPAVILGVAAAVAALFAAFAAGPIAVAVAAVLIAGFIAHVASKNDEFKNAVTGTWNAIKTVVSTVWNDYVKPALEVWSEKVSKLGAVFAEFWEQKLRPALQYIGREFNWLRETILTPLFTLWLWWMDKVGTVVVWLWKEIILPVVSLVGGIIKLWWENVIKPALQGIADFVRERVGPAFSWLYEHVIKPVWNRISLAISVAWASIQVVFGLIQIGVKIVAAVFGWLYDHAIKPVWDRIRPVFEAFGGFIRDHVIPVFRPAVEALGAIWNTLSDAAKAPIRFIIQTVLNDGLLAAYNWLAERFDVNPRNVRIPVPGWLAQSSTSTVSPGRGTRNIAFASGGFVSGPGTGTSDSIMARLSNGEYVIPARIVAMLGVDFFDQLIGRRRGRYVEGRDRFAEGGLVGWIKGAWNAITNPGKAIRDKVLSLFGGAGSGLMVDVAKGVATKLIDGVTNFIANAVAPSQPGGPGGGPLGGSAGMMRILRAVFPDLPLISGFRPGSRTLSGSLSYHASDRAVDVPPRRDVASWIFANYGRGTRELITPYQEFNLHNGQPHRYTGAVWMQHNFEGGNAHDHWAYRDGGLVRVPYLLRDEGGRIPPGLSLIDNRTGRDEWAFNDSQTRELVGAATGGRGDRAMVAIEHYHAHDTDPRATAYELDWLSRGYG